MQLSLTGRAPHHITVLAVEHAHVQNIYVELLRIYARKISRKAAADLQRAVKPGTHWRQSRLLLKPSRLLLKPSRLLLKPATKSTVAYTVDYVARMSNVLSTLSLVCIRCKSDF